MVPGLRRLWAWSPAIAVVAAAALLAAGVILAVSNEDAYRSQKIKEITVQAEIVKVMQPIWKRWAEERGPEAVKALAELKKVLGHAM